MPMLEDHYFGEKEAELRRKLREQLEAQAQAAARKEALKQRAGGSEELAHRLHDLGFDADTVPVLHLLPLVAVAWADGQVTSREREAVLRAAAAHGIVPGGKAALMLTSILEERPSKTVADQMVAVLRDLLAAKGVRPQSLLDACLDVASASGGFLGLGKKVNPEEQAFIASMAAMFSDSVQDRVVQRLA